jgi:hypothetical protein
MFCIIVLCGMVGGGVDVNFITHLTGLGSSLELGLSGSFGGPSLLEESLWDGDLLVMLVDVLVLHSMSSYDSSSSFFSPMNTHALLSMYPLSSSCIL